MRKNIITAALAVTAVAVLGAGPASARSALTTSPSSSVLWVPQLMINGGFGSVRCAMTLSQTLHASIPKIRGALAGNAHLAFSTGACASGNMGILAGGRRATGLSGPYHLQYQSFSGTLPNIFSVGLAIVGVSFWIQEPTFGITCLTSEPQSIPIAVGISNPADRASVTAATILLEGGFGCGFLSASMTGSGFLYTNLTIRSGANVTIRLI